MTTTNKPSARERAFREWREDAYGISQHDPICDGERIWIAWLAALDHAAGMCEADAAAYDAKFVRNKYHQHEGEGAIVLRRFAAKLRDDGEGGGDG